MIERDLDAVQGARFDVIVVGGGIYGVATALESAARGLRPLLLERADFGGATSASTLRIIHGGLRYLQSLDLSRFRRSVEQRRWWLKQFPELVRPFRCLMPLEGRGLRRRSVLRLALAANDLLSLDRNRGLGPEHRIRSGRILNEEETLALFPGYPQEGLAGAGLRGAALWQDASMDRPHRLLMEMIRWMVASGGIALNYVKAHELLKEDGRVTGLVAVDELTDREFDVRGPVVVNTAGPWSREVSRRFDREQAELFRPSLAFNVLLRKKLPATVAVALSPPRPDTPTYFLRPYGDRIFAGTFHAPWEGGVVADPEPDETQLEEFLGDLNEVVPDLAVGTEHIVRTYSGLLPATRSGSAEVRRHPIVVDHSTGDGVEGFLSVSGVKFTTAPAVAAQVVDRIVDHPSVSPKTAVADWKRMQESRPPIRSVPSASALDVLRQPEPPRGAIDQIRKIAREESVIYAEDLIERRLDWSLELEDLELADRQLLNILSELDDDELGASLGLRSDFE